MSRNRMPAAPAAISAQGISWDVYPKALQKWNAGVMAADTGDNTIGIYDVIGDYWGEGVTARRIAGALRSIGADKDVVVNINSPGGDLFEGLAIYNLLREHKGKVTVKVLGMAASAASVIAMAADELQIGRAAFLMIHNAWVLVMGNRNDLRAYADDLEPFDRAMADIYSARTGIDVETIAQMMDEESWIGGAEAIEKGFADEFLPSDQITESDDKKSAAIRQLDVALAKAGMPRSERRRIYKECKIATHDAGDSSGTHDAAIHREVVAKNGPLKLEVNLALNVQ